MRINKTEKGQGQIPAGHRNEDLVGMRVTHLCERVAVCLKCMIWTIAKLYQKCQNVHAALLRVLRDQLYQKQLIDIIVWEQ